MFLGFSVRTAGGQRYLLTGKTNCYSLYLTNRSLMLTVGHGKVCKAEFVLGLSLGIFIVTFNPVVGTFSPHYYFNQH